MVTIWTETSNLNECLKFLACHCCCYARPHFQKLTFISKNIKVYILLSGATLICYWGMLGRYYYLERILWGVASVLLLVAVIDCWPLYKLVTVHICLAFLAFKWKMDPLFVCMLHKGNMERSHVTKHSASGVKAIAAHKGVQVTQWATFQ